MAVVGEAQIIVRAITTNVERDIRRGFNNLDGAARSTGRNLGTSFSDGFNRSGALSVFGKVAEGLRSLAPEADAARLAYQRLARANFVLTPALGTLVGAIGSVIGGLGALVGAAGAAAAALAALGSIYASFGLGLVASRFALGGVGKALGALNNQTGGAARVTEEATTQTARYAKTLAEVREEMQQLRFDAEEAALSQEEAAIKLEQARDNLLRTADLPINSIARRQAELDFKQADLAYRRAKDRTEDLNAQIKKGIDNPLIEPQVRAPQMPTMGGGADPFAGLNQYQIDFVKFLMSLKPLYKDLQLTASQAFLPPLQNAITILARGLFPSLKQGIGLVAAANGQASIAIAESIANAENLADLDEIFVSSARQITDLGRIFGQFWDIAASILSSVAPQAERFLNFLEDRAGAFARFLDTEQANRRLSEFFRVSGNMLANFGEILGNIFGGFGQLIEANFGPGTGGQYLLDWLIEATDKFAKLDRLAGGSQNLSDYFLGASVNTQKVLSSVGALLREIIAAGDNPNIGRAFDILAEGAPAIGRILEKAADAGPAFAKFVVEIVKFFDAFTDTRSIEIFWDTVTLAVETLNNILSNELVRNILLTVSQVTALALALGSVFKVGQFAFSAIVGSVAFASGAIEKLVIGPAAAALGSFQMLRVRMNLLKKETILASASLTGMGAALTRVRLAGMFVGGVFGAIGRALGPLLRTGAVMAGFAAVAGGISSINKEGKFWYGNAALFSDSFKEIGQSVDGFAVKMNNAYQSLRGEGGDSFFLLPFEGLKVASGDLVQSISLIGGAVGQLAQFTDGMAEAFGITSDGLKEIQTIKAIAGEIDAGLSGLAQRNIPAATSGFRQLAQASNASADELIGFLDQLPGFKAELIDFANANGLATDDHNLLALALQRSPAAVRALKDEMGRMTTAALDSTGKIQALADGVRNMTQVFNDSLTDSLNYNESILNLSDALAQNGNDLSKNTREGIANQRAILDVINASNEAAASAYEQSGSLTELNSTLNANKEALVEQLAPLFESKQAARDYINTLTMTPGEIITKFGLSGIPQSRTAVEEFIFGIENKKPVNLPMTIRQAEALDGIKDVQDAGNEDITPKVDIDDTSLRIANTEIANLTKARTVSISTNISGASAKFMVNGQNLGTISIRASALGNLFEYLKGGLASYANGGFPTGIYKGRPGALYKFAEPETRWEAFISGKAGQEKRNIGIWKEAGRRLGVYNEAAMGAMQSTFGSQGLSTQSLVQQSAAAPRVENNIQITVNPSPGMDERDLASMVSRRLAYELRRGTYRT